LAAQTPTPAQEQTDVHIPEATVLEALRFSARLRLPSDTPDAVVTKFVDEVGVRRAADL
jgi:ABC-type multidrug transport system ATPase subunit